MARRPWFQFSLMTAIVMMLVAAVLMGLQMRPSHSSQTLTSKWTTQIGLSMRFSVAPRIFEGEPASIMIEVRNDSGNRLELYSPAFSLWYSDSKSPPCEFGIKPSGLGKPLVLETGQTKAGEATFIAQGGFINNYKRISPLKILASYMDVPPTCGRLFSSEIDNEIVLPWTAWSILYALLMNLPVVILAGVICEYLVRRRERQP
jgi:hypothetical protein